MNKQVKPLEEVLKENKKAMQEANKRHQDYLKKMTEQNEKEQRIQSLLFVIIVVLIIVGVFLSLHSMTDKAMQSCIERKGSDYCVQKLG